MNKLVRFNRDISPSFVYTLAKLKGTQKHTALLSPSFQALHMRKHSPEIAEGSKCQQTIGRLVNNRDINHTIPVIVCTKRQPEVSKNMRL